MKVEDLLPIVLHPISLTLFLKLIFEKKLINFMLYNFLINCSFKYLTDNSKQMNECKHIVKEKKNVQEVFLCFSKIQSRTMRWFMSKLQFFHFVFFCKIVLQPIVHYLTAGGFNFLIHQILESIITIRLIFHSFYQPLYKYYRDRVNIINIFLFNFSPLDLRFSE